MFSYATLLHAITLLFSDISKQDPTNICLFTAVRNLQLTFHSAGLEGLKSQRFSGPLTLTLAGSSSDIIYYVLSRNLVISTWTVTNILYEF